MVSGKLRQCLLLDVCFVRRILMAKIIIQSLNFGKKAVCGMTFNGNIIEVHSNEFEFEKCNFTSCNIPELNCVSFRNCTFYDCELIHCSALFFDCKFEDTLVNRLYIKNENYDILDTV